MKKKSGAKQSNGEQVFEDIRLATRKPYSAEDKVWTVWDVYGGVHCTA